MRTNGRRPLGRVRPGLTLIELLGAIALMGLMGLLLLPRLALDSPSAATSAPDDASPAPSCPFSTGAGKSVYIEQGRPSYVGTGARVYTDRELDGYVQMARPIPDSPAEQAGVEPGALILRVDGVSVQSFGVDAVAGMIKNGEVGSPVQLTLGRSGESEPLELTITRQRIYLPSRPD